MEEQPSAANSPAVFVIVSACEVDGCGRLVLSLRYLCALDPCHARDQIDVRAIERMG